MSDVRKDVGIVTAYGYAVEGGYQGTEAQYTELMGSIANIAQEATDAKTAAETAQGKAEDAQEAAETAQGKAEDAQEAAERAQGLADDAKSAANDSATSASESALKAEGFAVGEQNGVEVGSDSPYYHNNAKYYSEEAEDSATQAAASAATSAAMTGLAPQFVSTKAYSAGDYVLYNGTLYQFTSAHAAGAWTGTDATAVTLAPEVTDLKSHLEYTTKDLIENESIFPNYPGKYFSASGQGYNYIDITSPGTDSTWTAYLISCQEGDAFSVFCVGGMTSFAWAFIDSSGNILSRSTSNATVNGTLITAPQNAAHLVVNDKGGASRVYKNQLFPIRFAYKADNVMFQIASGGDISWSPYSESPPVYEIGTNNYIIMINGATYTFTPSDIASAATSANLTVTDGKISDVSYAIYFDLETKSIKAVSSISINLGKLTSNPIIFAAHFKSFRLGLAVNYMTDKRLESAENDITQNQADIATIQDTIDTGAAIPSYYKTHIENKVDEIMDDMCAVGKDGETFIFITDIHWENNNKHSPGLTSYLLDNLSIHNMICGGDIINQGTKSEMMKTMRECITAFQHRNIFMPCAYGNHDNNANGTQSTEHFSVAEQYALMQKQAETLVTYFSSTDNANQNWNCYYDVANTKTRFIIIDMSNNGTYNRFNYLSQCMLDTPSGYNIVLIGHWFIQSTITDTSRYLEMLCDAYNARQSVTIPTKGTFDMSSAVGTVRLMLGGHAHNNYVWYSDGGMPVITIDSDNGVRSVNTETPYASGTITEQSFGVFTVDYTNGVIKETKIGRGYNQIYNHGINSIAVSATTTLTTDITSPTWSSSDDSIATVNNGVVTGVSAGAVVITAKGTDTKENWCVVVS